MQKNFRLFRKNIWNYYHANKRAMPWRDTRNYYQILVSEIMLQQTQVSTVLKKYPGFIKQFPNFRTLARAPQSAVLREWQGLGYNRRAIALKKIAIAVVKTDGKLPRSIEDLDALPGIGHATASSIAVFAFNVPTVFIETNIRRVFIHHFFKNRKKVADSELLPLIEQVLDPKNPREWYFALMDYGAWLGKTTVNPNRRSRHYVKQKPFTGSRRELRGKMLRLLLKKRKLSAKEMGAYLKTSPTELGTILKALQKEGFIRKTANGFSLKR